MDTDNLVELQLPKSGYKVFLKESLTIGQSRRLQRQLLANGKFDSNSKTVEDISPDAFFDMQEKAIDMVIQRVVDKNGTEIGSTSYVDFVNDLPVADGNLIYDQITEIINGSSLSDDAQKKS